MTEFYWVSLSEEEIRENFGKLKDDVLSDTDLTSLVSVKTSDDLVKLVNAFKRALNAREEDKYFKSSKHKLAFMILRHQGKVFDEDLEIKKIHYIDKSMANEWKKKYQLMFHPDRNASDKSIDYKKVSQKINKIFNQMVGKA